MHNNFLKIIYIKICAYKECKNLTLSFTKMPSESQQFHLSPSLQKNIYIHFKVSFFIMMCYECLLDPTPN